MFVIDDTQMHSIHSKKINWDTKTFIIPEEIVKYFEALAISINKSFNDEYDIKMIKTVWDKRMLM